MRLFLSVSFLALLWLLPNPVAACGATPPSFTLLTDAMRGVPAGTKVLKLYVYGASIDPTPPKLILSADRRAGGLPVTIPVTLRVTAPWLVEVDLGSAAIQAGTSYSLSAATVESESGNTGYSAQLPFAGVEANRLPSELGQLMLDKRASGKMYVGGCGEQDEGEHALIKLVASTPALPWVRAVAHQLYVDGKPAFEPEIPLVDYVARTSETVIRAIAHCDRATSAGEIPPERGIELRLPAGQHSVKWTSTFPDGKTLETPAIDVDLRCTPLPTSAAPPCCKPLYYGDAGADVAVDAGLNVATAVDAGRTLAADAGVVEIRPPAQPLAEDGDDPMVSADEGCKLGSGQRGGAEALGLFVVLFLLHAHSARKRNQRSSRRSA